MAIDPKSLAIKAASVATQDQALLFVPKGKAQDYVKEVWKLSQETGYSPEILVAQWDLETDSGRSTHWVNRNNPGGIGVTDGGDLNYSWSTPADGARVQSVHISAYVDGYNYALRKYLDLDPRYQLVLKTDWATKVKTVADLTGKWATDPKYGEKIAGRLEKLRGTKVTTQPPVVVTPSDGNIVFGRVPRPSIVNRLIPDSANVAWDNLGQRDIYGVVYHRQDGTNWGTDGWFRTLDYLDNRGVWQPGGGRLGLTDFGISAKTGEILQWNSPLGFGAEGVSPNRSGWASGPWQDPPGDGRAFVKKYGANGINRFLASFEIDQWADSPIDDAGYQSIVSLSAHLADLKKVPWNTYPLNPATGLVFTYTHNEFQSFKSCPGSVVLALIPDIIADTKEMLKSYQVG